jgi:hypothetical protein
VTNKREPLAIALERTEARDVFRISGTLDEEAHDDLARVSQAAGKVVVFNFAGLKLINSAGTRAWVLFFRPFAKGRSVVFAECTPDVVGQTNMVPAFAEGATVESVFAPYRCEACRRDVLVLMQAETFPESADALPPGRCDRCSGETEFVGGQEYFVFADSN